MESLENRRLLSAVTWTGLAGNGLWSSANNWSPAAVPTTGDTVSIGSGFSTITIASGTAAIGSLNSDSPITLTSGTMTVTGGADLTANFTLNGGTIANSTFVFSNNAEMVGSTSGNNILDGDTIFGTIDLGTASSGTALVQVKDGLTMGSPADNQTQGGRILVGTGTTNKGEVNFDGAASQILTGTDGYNVSVILGNNASDQVDNTISTSGGTVTLGAVVTVSGTQGFLNAGSVNEFINQGSILANGGNSLSVFGKLANQGTLGVSGNSTLVLNGLVGNVGTVSPITDASTLQMNNNVGGSFTINSPISVTNGTLTILGTVTNQSTITVSSGTLNLTLSASSSNTGTINLTNSTANLRGDFTPAALGTLTRSGGTINLIGTLENSSNTFALNSTTGPWVMDAGSIIGGTISESGTGQLQFAASTSSILNGVTLDGNLDLSQATGITAQIQNGLTLGSSPDTPTTAPNILIGNNPVTHTATLQFSGSAAETVAPVSGGTAKIVFGGTSSDFITNNVSNGSGVGSAVTFAPGITIAGAFGQMTTTLPSSPSSMFINQGLIDSASGGITITAPLQNQGTLEADAGGSITASSAQGNLNTVVINGTGKVSLGGNYVNNLGLAAPSGSTLALAGTWTNSAPITATSATLTIGGTFNNNSTITSTSSITNLAGTSFTTANLGTFTRSGGTVNLTGALNNASSTLTLNNTTGPWILSGGSVTGGIISESGAGQLLVEFNGSGNNLLDGVTIDGNLDLSQVNDAVTQIKDGLTIGSSPDTPTTPGALILGNAAGSASGDITFVGNVAQTIAPVAGQTMEIRFGASSGSQNQINNDITSGGSVGLPITFAPGVTVDGKNGVLAGQFATSSYINQGIVNSSGGGTITASAKFQNLGTVQASNGTLNITQLTNLSSGTLSGGVYEADAHSTLNINGNITTDSATLILDGTSSLIANSSANALARLNAVSAGANLSLKDGQGLADAPTSMLTNDGSISVSGGSTLAVTGAFTQNADGTLVTQLASNTSFGKVTSTGAMTLNGSVQATLASGYDPSSSVTFTIASGSALTQSATLANASTPSGRALLMRFNTTSAIVAILPLAPSTPVMTAATDTGTSQTDGITNNNTPSFAGSAQDAGVIDLFQGSTLIGTAAISGGSWVVTTAPGLADGSYQVTAQVVDTAGDAGPSSGAQTILIDMVAPTITASINSPASTGWYNISTGAAVVSYTASDNVGGSGLASAAPGNYTFADGANQSLAAVTISDIAGNTATSQSFSGINQDTVAPSISATISSPDSSTGWYNIASGAAVVTYGASDATSGLASAVPGAYTFSDGANQSLAGVTIYDNAGNSATSQAFSGINQDTVAPTINATITSPDSTTGWYNIATGAAVVSYSASDNAGGSGLASAVPGSYTFADGTGQSLASVTISDIAGNTATSQSFSGINQDTVAPTISATITSPDSSTGWYNIASGPAVVSYTASDNAGGSGLASAVPGNYVFADGSDQSLAAVTISDVAGNTTTSQGFSGIDQDTVAPTINAAINSPDSTTGWYNIATGAATVTYTAADSGSGLLFEPPGSFVFGDGANQSLDGVVVWDVAGNTATSQAFSGINQDTVAPVIVGTISSPDSSTGWYNIASGAAVVSYSAADNAGGSGLASAVPGNVTFADGANQSLAGVTISDIAGNSSTSNGFSGINQDTVAPTISASINSPDGATGWYNIATGAAVVSYTASDNAGGSGLASVAPGNYVFADGANQSLAGVTISDIAGNTATSQGFSGINQDTVAPTISASINSPDGATGWYNIATGAAVVSYTASDNAGGSGLSSAAPGSYTFADGANQSLAAVTISDVAGNTAASQAFSNINQDTIAPTVTATINSAASTGWYNIATGPAVVSYTASDSGSGLASAVPGNYTFADGANQSLAAVTISDIAGNTAASQAFSGINQDTVAPTIAASINSPASMGWYNISTGPAVVTYSASDGGSGLASAAPGNYTFADGANQSLAAVTISDIAGNTATSQAFAGVSQDTVAPTITATINSPSSSGWYNIASGPAMVSYSASDSGSGLATAVPGNHTFSDGANQSLAGVAISDVAGNTATSQAFSGINQDTVAPTITATISAPASNGWYNIASGPAVVTYAASDNAGGSGLASAVPAPYTFADGTNQSIAGATVSDVAGNTATSQGFSGIKQDTVAPAAPAAPTVTLNGTTPTYSGTAEANSTVNIYADGGTTPVATTVALANGTYSVAGPALSSGVHTITATATDVAGNLSAQSQATAVQVGSTQAAVLSTNVRWGTAGNIPVYMTNGFLLPAGRQTDLPWIGINRIQITLSQSATLTAANVQVTGVNIANYGPVTVSGSGTQYTITFARPVNDADRLTITIGNSKIATFTAKMNILPGDVNDDGSVTVADIDPELEAWLKIQGARPTVWEDVNGDGQVDLPDVIDTLISLNEHLPPQ